MNQDADDQRRKGIRRYRRVMLWALLIPASVLLLHPDILALVAYGGDPTGAVIGWEFWQFLLFGLAAGVTPG